MQTVYFKGLKFTFTFKGDYTWVIDCPLFSRTLNGIEKDVLWDIADNLFKNGTNILKFQATLMDNGTFPSIYVYIFISTYYKGYRITDMEHRNLCIFGKIML